MSVEEKIKRAEEIYNRRKGYVDNNTARMNINPQKDFVLFKRMIIQIIICLSIYSCYYLIVNHNYVFSDDFIKKSQEILSYDIDFNELYNYCMSYVNQLKTNQEQETKKIVIENETNDNKIEDNTTKNIEQNNENDNKVDGNIGGAEDTSKEEKEDNKQNTENKTETSEVKQTSKDTEATQMEQDAKYIKDKISFVKPIEGTISSVFGWRNPTTSTVPKYHTGLDIAATTGTVIKSSTDGVVSLASSEGDYRKSLKNN